MMVVRRTISSAACQFVSIVPESLRRKKRFGNRISAARVAQAGTLPDGAFIMVKYLLFRIVILTRFAPLAQLDRASDYESEGREFESLRARHKTPVKISS